MGTNPTSSLATSYISVVLGTSVGYVLFSSAIFLIHLGFIKKFEEQRDVPFCPVEVWQFASLSRNKKNWRLSRVEITKSAYKHSVIDILAYRWSEFDGKSINPIFHGTNDYNWWCFYCSVRSFDARSVRRHRAADGRVLIHLNSSAVAESIVFFDVLTWSTDICTSNVEWPTRLSCGTSTATAGDVIVTTCYTFASKT